MSLYALRFRRALSLSSSIINTIKSTVSSTIIPSPSFHLTQNSRFLNPVQCRTFRSSTISLSSRPRSTSYNSRNDEDAFDGEILFEGCDFNHWLITIDFPKDPKLTPEEMVEFYVQTAAKVVGSVEEAKKKIYACSTTTYQGFQIEVTEEMSEKFRDLPRVVFILPDSYIDPTNKEYGGAKYENGIITHRPPPVQHGRQGVKYSDRNDGNRTRGSYQQGNSRNEIQGPYRNIGRQQSPRSQQNYGPQQSLQPQQNYGLQQGANVRRDNIPVINNYSNEPIGQESYGESFNQGSSPGSGQRGGTQRQGAGQLSGRGSGWSSGQSPGQGGYGRGSYGQTGRTHGYDGVGGNEQPSGLDGVGGYGQGSSSQTGGTQGQGGYEQGSYRQFGDGGVGSYGQGVTHEGQGVYHEGQGHFGERGQR